MTNANVISNRGDQRLSTDPQFGALPLKDGRISFKFWAPNKENVKLVLIEGDKETVLDLEHDGEGWFSTVTDKARVGTHYAYLVDGELKVPDPASRYQPKDIHGPSEVCDPNAYRWVGEWKGLPWEETVLYELHVGTFSEAGTFEGVTEKLLYLKELGVNAIELMPVADFPGKWNWGYDGVLLFAPDSVYGHPDDLKKLVQTAHDLGMQVFMDVVYNHFGPEGNYLYVYAKDFFNEKHHTPWGAAINYDGKNNQHVRRFYVENVLYWLNEFKMDGIRFDAVHAIADDSKVHILNEIAAAVRSGPGKERHIHLVLENDDNRSTYLSRVKNGQKVDLYDAQWTDDIHHAMHVIGTGESSGYYADYAAGTSAKSAVEHLARCLSEGFAYQNDPSPFRDGEKRGESSKHLPPSAFVAFIQNHDQVGNRAFGDRINAVSSPEAVAALTSVLLLSPQIPLLFMGEEWSASTPFNFFCDLGPDLAPLVTEGRRNEFAKFDEFKSEANRAKIPDPVAPETFQRSKLNWHEIDGRNKQLELTKRLLQIRAEKVVSLFTGGKSVKSTQLFADDKGLVISWIVDGKSLLLAANLSKETVDMSEHLSSLSGSEVIFETGEETTKKFSAKPLAPWTVIWCVK